MDFQHRAGGKTGSGGVASGSESHRDRRERLRLLALETIDLQKDPYFMKNHLGSYECRLCLTLHNNEGSYLAHTQGRKHQDNLGKRAAKEAKDAPQQPAPEKARVDLKKFVKIGRPGYRVNKQKEPESGQQSLLFQIDYPEIVDGIIPRHRFMSAYEQKVEPPDRDWQYLLFAAEPYETIAFKVPSREVEKGDYKFWTLWNKDTKQFYLQFTFKLVDKMSRRSAIAPPPPVIPSRFPVPSRGTAPSQQPVNGTLPPPPPMPVSHNHFGGHPSFAPNSMETASEAHVVPPLPDMAPPLPLHPPGFMGRPDAPHSGSGIPPPPPLPPPMQSSQPLVAPPPRFMPRPPTNMIPRPPLPPVRPTSLGNQPPLPPPLPQE